MDRISYADEAVRIKNGMFEWPLILWWVGLAVALGLLSTRYMNIDSAGAIDNILDALIQIVLFVWLMRKLRMPLFQKYLRISADGIRYGPKLGIRWDQVESIAVLKPRIGRKHLILRTRDWKGRGLARGKAARILPLTGFNTRISPDEWVRMVETNSPATISKEPETVAFLQARAI